jgi:uncharacterized protein YegP (UPF0339 family)
MPGKFEVKQAKNGKFFFNLKAGNGEIILTSQMYADKRGCKNGIESVKKNSASDALFEAMEDKSGSPYFVLKAKNQEVIGRSESYSSKSSMKKGMASVMKNASDARVVEIEAQ